MRPAEHRIVVINPGSTSTKFAVYADEKPLHVENLKHGEEELKPFRRRSILDQFEFRAGVIEAALVKAGFDPAGIHAAVGRGGLLPPIESGTYRVDATMLETLRAAKRGEHASNLGAFLAHAAAQRAGVDAFVVDPVSVDEFPPVARLSGSALFERESLSHALNSKAVAKRHCKEKGRSYNGIKLLVAHLGSGITVSAHREGRMVDVTNSREEGAFSTERAGSVPCVRLAQYCLSPGRSFQEVETQLFREGGLYSYLGTKDLQEVEQRVAAGDEKAALVFDAMAYQIAKEIGAMATVLGGGVEAILLTGGMARSERLCARLTAAVGWIAPVSVYPGEDELQALAEGALRVLRGEERPRTL